MNKKQWFVLAIVMILFNFIFIHLDSNHGLINGDYDFCDWQEEQALEQYNNGEITVEEYGDMISSASEIDEYKVYCLIRGEIYAPFIYLSYMLMFVFFVMGLLETKKRK